MWPCWLVTPTDAQTAPPPRVVFPSREPEPLRSLALRVGVALGLLALVALITRLARDGYRDAGVAGGPARDERRRHPGADPVPDHPRRHDDRTAHPALPRGDGRLALEETDERPHHHRRLRHGNSIESARRAGITTVVGDGTRTEVLRQALIERARAIIVTPRSDDTATLVTLTARELNRTAVITAAVREAE